MYNALEIYVEGSLMVRMEMRGEIIMFSIAICDDEEFVCSEIERYLEPLVKTKKVKTEVFYSGEKVYEALLKGDYFDLIFLDIELKTLNGVDVGKKIRDELQNERIHIVYISAESKYAMDLFEVRPLHFLIKPISKEKVLLNVEKAMRLTDAYEDYFESHGQSLLRIPYADILYFESNERKIKIHTVGNNNEYEIYGKLNEIKKEAPLGFIRIHQSFLVNYIYIRHWQYEGLILKNNIKLPISQNYRKEVRNILLDIVKKGN